MTLSGGIDVGTGMVKVAVYREPDDGTRGELLTTYAERLRRRDQRVVIQDAWDQALALAGVKLDDFDYVATTGEGDLVDFRRGHFYSMTTHARGALFLDPKALAAVDVGALNTKAIRMNEDGRVLSYRMTSQCASGSGQFVENISRYLGITLEEVGSLSRQAENPEAVSSICAVLAETDVINMVSRGISTANILKGIHLSMAGRIAKLLKAARVEGRVMMTGGLSQDTGLVSAVQEIVREQDLPFDVVTHPLGVHAGAIGAAVFGAFRHRVLESRKQGAQA